MTSLNLQLFGQFQAMIGSQRLAGFRSDKVRALLAYLAVESGRKHTRTELATLFWGGLDDKAARANLRKSLFRLRQTLGDAAETVLTLTNHDVQFEPTSPNIDVHQFTQLAQSNVLSDLVQAADLYQGQLLTGLDISDAPDFEDWLSHQREQFYQQYLTLLDQLGELYLAQADYGTAQAVARRQLALEPWRETAHRQLLRAYAAAGQRTEALNQHERFVAILAQELGLSPATETETLVAAIRDEQIRSTHLHNFAAPQTQFVGRERDIQQIIARLSAPNTRLITLTGPGGIGKTRLAVEAVTRNLGYRQVYFLSLEGLTTQAGVWQLLAERLGIKSSAGSRIDREVIAFLRERAPLLLFDNYEQLLPDTGCIEQLLSEAPDVQLLVTSRSPLNLRAEWRLPIEGLALPTENTSDLSEFSAVQLLLTVGQQVQPGLSLSSENAPHIGRICHALAGMPLALEMAGSWLSLFSPAQLADEIERNLDFLVATHTDIPNRHRSLRAIFDYTLAQLNEAEQSLLRSLTIFHGDFSLKAVRTILDAAPMTLYKLIDHALVQHRRNDHFGLHPVLGAFLSEEEDASATSGLAAKRQAHARYYLQRIAPICDYNVEVTVKDISYELANVQAAWDWAVAHNQADFLEPAIDGQLAYYQFRGSFEEARAQFSSAATVLSSPELIRHLQFAEATCLQKLGDLQTALRVIQPLVDSNDDDTRLQALIRLGELYEAQQDYALAKHTLYEALLLAQLSSEQAALVWNVLGVVHARCNETTESLTAHQKSLLICAELENDLLTAENQANLAMTYCDAARYDQAIKHITQALAIVRRLEHRSNLSRYTEYLAEIYWRRDDVAQAQQGWEQALSIAEALNHKRNIMRYCQKLATIATRSGHQAQALHYQQRATEIAEQLSETPQLIDSQPIS